MSELRFDASTVAPAMPFEPVPAGWYTCIMSASQKKPSASSQNAFYHEFEFTVQEPAEYAGRKLFDRVNTENPNPTTVEIAFKTISAICHAVGVIKMEHTEQLHNKPLMVKASMRPAGPGNDGKYYDANNEVKGYKAVQGGGAAATTVAAPAALAAGAQGGAWQPPAPPPAVAPAPAPAPVAAAPAAPAPPAPPPAPAAPPAPPPPVVFPPEGWVPHPDAPGYFYKGQEVLTEAQLREKMAAPAWTAAPTPAAPAAQPAAADPAPAAAAASTEVPPWMKK